MWGRKTHASHEPARASQCSATWVLPRDCALHSFEPAPRCDILPRLYPLPRLVPSEAPAVKRDYCSRAGQLDTTLRHVTTDKTPRCVLIVEDDDDSREMLGELVSAFGHHPLPAANVTEALAQARGTKPDVALIDIGLPEVDGCEVARLLREAMAGTPGAPIRLVALTGYSDGATRQTAGDAGFDDYMVKPVLPEALEALLGA